MGEDLSRARSRAERDAIRDAIRDLVQAGYKQSPDLTAKIAIYQKGLRSQMIAKYQERGGELLRQLGELE